MFIFLWVFLELDPVSLTSVVNSVLAQERGELGFRCGKRSMYAHRTPARSEKIGALLPEGLQV